MAALAPPAAAADGAAHADARKVRAPSNAGVFDGVNQVRFWQTDRCKNITLVALAAIFLTTLAIGLVGYLQSTNQISGTTFADLKEGGSIAVMAASTLALLFIFGASYYIFAMARKKVAGEAIKQRDQAARSKQQPNHPPLPQLPPSVAHGTGAGAGAAAVAQPAHDVGERAGRAAASSVVGGAAGAAAGAGESIGGAAGAAARKNAVDPAAAEKARKEAEYFAKYRDKLPTEPHHFKVVPPNETPGENVLLIKDGDEPAKAEIHPVDNGQANTTFLCYIANIQTDRTRGQAIGAGHRREYHQDAW